MPRILNVSKQKKTGKGHLYKTMVGTSQGYVLKQFLLKLIKFVLISIFST